VVYKLKCSCGHSCIGQTQRNLKFRLDEHNSLKSNHQATDVVKHLYTYAGHFTDFKNPEILASAFNYREVLIKGLRVLPSVDVALRGMLSLHAEMLVSPNATNEAA